VKRNAALLLLLNGTLGVACAVAIGFAACGRAGAGEPASTPSGSASVATSASALSVTPDDDAPDPLEGREAALWLVAADGGEDDFARLADLEGSSGLVERGTDPALRMTALHALAFVHDFGALPWLSEVADTGPDAEASAALAAINAIAAQPRRSVDPEDRAELHVGCDRLLRVAKESKSRDRRIGAIDALRMMIDRGCAKADQIPTDLDAK
jgi:hypothetical protein